jgi:hypothetical protein
VSGLDSQSNVGFGVLTDGTAPSSDSQVEPVGDGTGGYSSGYTTLIYNLPASTNLSALNLYFYWSDSGRWSPPAMTISTSPTSYSISATYTPLESFPGYSPGDHYSEVSFADSAGGNLASGIGSIEINFAGTPNGWAGLGEIDAIGGAPEPTSLACLGIAGAGLLLRRRHIAPC